MTQNHTVTSGTLLSIKRMGLTAAALGVSVMTQTVVDVAEAALKTIATPLVGAQIFSVLSRSSATVADPESSTP